MIEQLLHKFARENLIAFENALASYVKESLINQICTKGFSSCLCLRNPGDFSEKSYRGRVRRELRFYYLEDERILKSDGFVPGCPFGQNYLADFVKEVLQPEEEIFIKNEEIVDNTIFFDVYCENMYVPFSLEIVPKKQEGYSMNQKILSLPIRNESFEVLTYPVEQEAAGHLGKILKELELINEMEHYLALFDIFSNEALEGVRLQTALDEVLKEQKISLSENRLQTVLGYREYSYMKKKWKVLLRRQNRTSPAWEEVIELLKKVVEPVWKASEEEIIFFGDWMPEIGRFLD